MTLIGNVVEFTRILSLISSGIATGLLAGYIVTTTDWLSDLKEGYCTAGFYLNKKACCAHILGLLSLLVSVLFN